MPKEYIERNKLMDSFDYYQDCFQTEHDYDLTLSIAQGTEIVDDVVETVKCKECRFCFSHENLDCCDRLRNENNECLVIHPEGYCFLGERKDGTE